MRILDLLSLGSLSLLASGCGGGSDVPIVRVFDRAAEGEYAPREAEGASDVLVDLRDGPDGEWFALAVQDLVPGEQRPRGAALTEDGRLELGPQGGAWMCLVEVDPGDDLLLTARLEGDDLGVDYAPPFANMGLIEFDALPDREQLHSLLGNSDLIATWTPNFPFHIGSTEPTLIAPLGSNTHAVAVVCLYTSKPGAEPGAEPGNVSYSDLVLRRASRGDRRAAILNRTYDSRDPLALAIGEIEIGMMTRPALCLLVGDEVRIPVTLPRTASRFEVNVGIPPSEDDPLHPALGQTVALSCTLSIVGDSTPIIALSTELESVPFGQGRWRSLSSEIPSSAHGRRAELILRALHTGAGSARSSALPAIAVAEPRLVPVLPERVGPAVVLISIDTLRADHVGCYGYDRDTTPNLDALAQRARVYTDVWASSCYTLPSHMSMLTGQMPSMHAVTKPGILRDPNRSPLLAEILRERGYTTAAFTGGVFVDREFGFAAGFESYGAVDPIQLKDSTLTDNRVSGVPGLTHALIEENDTRVLKPWLKAHANESFFLFFHTYAAHEFDPPQRHRSALGFERSLSDDEESQGLIGGGGYMPSAAQVARLVDLYDGGVRFADEGVGELLDAIRELGLMDNTIIVVTSDHGKEIGEHGIVGHGHALYEELLQIPLILYVPPGIVAKLAAREPGTDSRAAMLVDVVPTILELLDIGLPLHLQGRSLLGPVDSSRVRLAEVDNLAIKYALRSGVTKTIHNPLDSGALLENLVEQERYDLERDPGEQSPLTPDASRLAELKAEFLRLKILSSETGETRQARELSESTRAQMNALGYVDEAKL